LLSEHFFLNLNHLFLNREEFKDDCYFEEEEKLAHEMLK